MTKWPVSHHQYLDIMQSKDISLLKTIFISLILGMLVFISHYKSPILTSFDSRYSIHITESLIKNHDINLDEYPFSKNRADYALFQYNNHTYSIYPIVPSIIAIPFALIIDKTITDRAAFYKICERATAAGIVALTTIVIFYMVNLVSESILAALLLSVCFAYSTSAWSIASRGLWSNGPCMLIVALVLYVVLYAMIYHKPQFIPIAGVLAGLAYVARPTASVLVLLLTIFVFIKFRKQFVWFILGGLGVAALFAGFNKYFYGLVFHPYYSYPLGINFNLLSPWIRALVEPNPHVIEALLGHLISPNRGLLVFSPVFLFCIVGLWIKIKNRTFNALDLMLVGVFLLNLFVISKAQKGWWGGYSFGPRYFTDILPILIYFLIPVVIWLLEGPISKAKRIIYGTSFLLCVLFGVFVHYQGATSSAVWKWNSTEPLVDWVHGTSDHIDWHPERVWDYHDLQFLRGITR